MKTRSSIRRAVLLWCLMALSILPITVRGTATLTNRYRFNESSGTTASDSISGQNGTLMNTTFTGSGQADLFNTANSGDPSGQYLALPANLLVNYSSVTLEAWVTPVLDDFTIGAEWSRIYDFGNSDGTNGVPGFMWMRVGNDYYPVRGDIFGPSSGDVVETTGFLLSGQENHIVWTSDGSTGKGQIYLNGVRVGRNDNVVTTPVAVGSTTNDWLGRSQFAADPYPNASYNEFRIYQGALNPLEVAADFQNGPGAVSSSYGTITNIQLQIASPMARGTGVKAVVLAAATGLTNKAVDIAASSFAITYTSGNTNIIRVVDTNGTISAVGSGTTTVIANYASLSSTQSVTVFLSPTKLIHRYSFTNDVSDSVGGADGTLQGASIAGGRVLLGTNAYVNLPAYLITPTNLVNGAYSISTWATIYPNNGTWAMLFVFGNVAGANGVNYTFFQPNAGGPFKRFSVGTIASSEDQAQQAGALTGTNVQIVCVFNPNPSRKLEGLYVNGTLVGSKTGTLLHGLSDINDVVSLLGRSLFSADPYFQGEIDEFRMYDGELDVFQIAAGLQAGPNSTNMNIGTFQSFTLDAGGSMPKDDSRQISALMSFSLATNVNVSADPNFKLISSDTNVVSASSGGIISSHAVGSATVTGIYQYVTGTTTNFYTNTTPITVFRNSGAVLQHRYSFTSDASDSIGGANGTLMGSAVVSGGMLRLYGTNSSYVNLPGGIVTSNQAATIEAWVVFRTNSAWARLFDFGSTAGYGTNITGPQAFWWCGPNDGAFFRSDIVTPAGFANILGAPPLPNGQSIHLVVIYDPSNNFMAAYTNGTLRLINFNAPNVPLASVSVDDAFIGKSQFTADPYLRAEIDEFRIYNGVLYADEIAATKVLGADQPLSTAAPTLSVSPSGSNLVIKWPLASAGFTLQSRPSLTAGAWAPVQLIPQIVGSNWQVTVPVTGSAQFFRLVK